MAKAQLKGVVFDLDGVITDTARLHQDAWEDMFNDFLQQWSQREGIHFAPFDPGKDYHTYVDGKPRYQGVQSFLESRGIELPWGDDQDSPDQWTVCGLGNRKNQAFGKVLRADGPDVYETSVELVKSLRAAGVRTGIASSSRNAQEVLEMGGVAELFDTRVDGVVSKELGLAGKPEPDIFVSAARNMGLSPAESVVVEDAISGVAAGAKGGFGLTLGIARSVAAESLREAGADVVVSDLGEISTAQLMDEFEKKAAGA
ncbi:MAG: HAD family hydrolase [Desulfovibrionaceae bacterium]